MKTENELILEGWISIEQLPKESMKVTWLCDDGKEDHGFYFSENQEFGTWDMISTKQITHWKPFKVFGLWKS